MIIHTVSKGETFSSIAAKYGIPLARLLEDNGISNPDFPLVGQSLLILHPRATHIVRQGETLQSIADFYQTTLRTLYRNNPFAIENPIYPGQQLVLSFRDRPIASVLTNGYAYSFIPQDTQKKILPYLTDFTLFTYGFDEGGNLIAPVPDDTPVIETAIYSGADPVLLLSTLGPDGTFDSRLAGILFSSPEATEKLIAELIVTMKQKGFRGIDVDFEYLPPEDKERYSAFIALLQERMNAEGFGVMVALAPKTAREQPGLLYEGHDYKALGENADAVLLMTYEWGYAFGPPGAIAPIDKVQEVVDYALSEIPPEKIFLGIPNYGYDWTLPYTVGGERAKTISPLEAVAIAQRYGAEILFDEQSASPYFYYTAEDGKEHVVHFEDVRSYNKKMQLVAEKGLGGFSVWTVMHDTPALFMLANVLFDIL